MKYDSPEHLAQARARFWELDARISPKLGKLRSEDRLPVNVNTSTVLDALPSIRQYHAHGGAAPTDAEIDTAVRAACRGNGPAAALDDYAKRAAEMERNLGRPLTPIEKLTIAREVGHVDEPRGAAAARSSVALTNEAIAAYIKQWEAATGKDARTLSAIEKISIASTYHAQALAASPASPVSAELKALGREPQTPQEKLAVAYEQRARGEAA